MPPVTNERETPIITPELGRRHPSRIPQASDTPRKGILKRSTRARSQEFSSSPFDCDVPAALRATVSYSLADAFWRPPPSPRSPLAAKPTTPTTPTRPTVGFSDRHTVTIIGDTSDEYDSNHLPRIPETSLFTPQPPPPPPTQSTPAITSTSVIVTPPIVKYDRLARKVGLTHTNAVAIF